MTKLNLTLDQIRIISQRFDGQEGFRPVPVENFLMTLPEHTSFEEDNLNLAMDARSYRWKKPIVDAIELGIRVAHHKA